MIEDYFQDLGRELSRPQVLVGLALFAVAVGLLWHAWKDRNTPVPFGLFMPF
jgi:hypothetical protein